jgi:hypothetical protein
VRLLHACERGGGNQDAATRAMDGRRPLRIATHASSGRRERRRSVVCAGAGESGRCCSPAEVSSAAVIRGGARSQGGRDTPERPGEGGVHVVQEVDLKSHRGDLDAAAEEIVDIGI